MKTDTPRTNEWETYCDESYYHLWRVRRKNERGFNDGYHVHNGEEAKALVDLLNKQDSELTSACQEIDMLKSKYADHHAEAERLTSEINAVTKQRDKIDLMYHKIIKEVLECDPIPACKRKDDQLEPPWEVIARVREQRDRLAEALKNIASGIYAWHTCVDKLAPEALLLTTNEL